MTNWFATDCILLVLEYQDDKCSREQYLCGGCEWVNGRLVVPEADILQLEWARFWAGKCVFASTEEKVETEPDEVGSTV
jgi:hypothetical protein